MKNYFFKTHTAFSASTAWIYFLKPTHVALYKSHFSFCTFYVFSLNVNERFAKSSNFSYSFCFLNSTFLFYQSYN